jgi:hypothetical protein
MAALPAAWTIRKASCHLILRAVDARVQNPENALSLGGRASEAISKARIFRRKMTFNLTYRQASLGLNADPSSRTQANFGKKTLKNIGLMRFVLKRDRDVL